MRITSQTLHSIAQDAVRRRTRRDRDVVSVYLQGSVLTADPVLGGTADVDLVFIHNSEPQVEREIESLTDEVHLDIAHHSRSDYRDGRQLRLHPWLGPAISSCKIMYDPHHFLDFTQASVRGLFDRPENVLQRAQNLAQTARQIWFRFYQTRPDPGPGTLVEYLRAVEHATNAVVSLTGHPLPERRLLLHLPGRLDEIGRSGLFLGVVGLLGGGTVDADTLREWLPDWEDALDAVARSAHPPLALHPHRRAYYRRAIEAMLESDEPMTGLWPYLHTWTRAVAHLSPRAVSVKAWKGAFEHLALIGPGFAERIAALDAYLDTVEETLEVWGRETGA